MTRLEVKFKAKDRNDICRRLCCNPFIVGRIGWKSPLSVISDEFDENDKGDLSNLAHLREEIDYSLCGKEFDIIEKRSRRGTIC